MPCLNHMITIQYREKQEKNRQRKVFSQSEVPQALYSGDLRFAQNTLEIATWDLHLNILKARERGLVQLGRSDASLL